MTLCAAVLELLKNSRLLSEKVLPVFDGSPLVLLAARPAEHTGRPFMVSTSPETAENVLAAMSARSEKPFCLNNRDTRKNKYLKIPDVPKNCI